MFENKSHIRLEQILWNTFVYALGQILVPRTLSIADHKNLRKQG